MDSAFYIGAGVGQFNVDADLPVTIDDEDAGSVKFDESDTGFKVFGGYQSGWFGAELAYLDGGAPSRSDSDPELGSLKVELEFTAITPALVGVLPIGDMFELYGKLGMTFWETELKGSVGGPLCGELTAVGESCSESVRDDGADLFYGVGAGVNIGEHFNVRVEYEIYDIDSSMPTRISSRAASCIVSDPASTPVGGD